MPVAIITGASRGLGRALATGLAGAGWRLVVDARGAEALAATERELRTLTEVVALPGDIADAGHREELAAAARSLGGSDLGGSDLGGSERGGSAAGGPDLLVNNAGILGPSPLPPLGSYPLADLREVLEVNVVAPLALTQLVLPALRGRGGAVLNVTSDAAVEGYPGWGGYGLAKAALEQASRVLAAEEPDLRVWWVDPGDLRTAMHQAAFPGEDISDRPLPETAVPGFLRLLTRRPPSGRYRAVELATVGG